MIQSYTKYKQFKSLVDAMENGEAVRSGLDFLRFVAEEYSRLEVYNNQECDGDEFFTYRVEKELAQVLRDEATPIESVATAQKEMAEIEKMEAYDDYCLCFFDHIREAINFRLAYAETYLADLDKQIKHHTYEYKRLVNDENFDQLSSVFRFEELGKLLIKKIEYLRSHGRENEVDGIMEEYKFVPDVCSFKINELLGKGLEDEAVKEIDKTIAAYGDDGYNATETWHLQKVAILEKLNDKAGLIEEYRRLFRQHLVDKRTYFEKLKELVAKEEWDEFVVKLFGDIPHITDDDCILVCDMIVEEKKFSCLMKILMDNVMSFSRVQLFKKYAPYMSEEDQATYTNYVIEELRMHLGYAKSKSYGYIVDDIKGMYTCCEVSKKLILDFMEEVEYNYGNRPALMRLLRN